MKRYKFTENAGFNGATIHLPLTISVDTPTEAIVAALDKQNAIVDEYVEAFASSYYHWYGEEIEVEVERMENDAIQIIPLIEDEDRVSDFMNRFADMVIREQMEKYDLDVGLENLILN